MSGSPDYVVVVDDLAVTRSWLRNAVLQAFPHALIHESDSLAGARRLCEETPPDLLLIDLRLPDGNGVSLIRELRKAAPQSLAVVPSIFDDDGYLFEAICAGAIGYVLKDHTALQLSEALRAIVVGQPALSASLARRILRQIESHAIVLEPDQTSLLQGRARGLSTREAGIQAGLDEATTAAAVRDIYLRLRD